MYLRDRARHPCLVTKPATQLLEHHNSLIAAAKKHNVVCFVEHHKRFDQFIAMRKRALGLWVNSISSMPGWASRGVSSKPSVHGQEKIQISGKCLTWIWHRCSHFLTSRKPTVIIYRPIILIYTVGSSMERPIPTRVVASAATGIATSEPYSCVPQTEDYDHTACRLAIR